MAKTNNNETMLFNLVLVLSALLLVSMADGRLFGVGFGKAQSTPQCQSVYGVSQGDTCFVVTQFFNMTTEFFSAINPNLDCTKLFVGQWLCVAGTIN